MPAENRPNASGSAWASGTARKIDINHGQAAFHRTYVGCLVVRLQAAATGSTHRGSSLTDLLIRGAHGMGGHRVRRVRAERHRLAREPQLERIRRQDHGHAVVNWRHGRVGCDRMVQRKDRYSHPIRWEDYEDEGSQFGWFIEAIDPEEREFTSNLRPVSYRGRQLESGKEADTDRP